MTRHTDHAVFDMARRVMDERLRRGRMRCVGVSSDALTAWAFGRGPEPLVPGTPVRPLGTSWTGEETGRDYPHDLADLDACRLTVALAAALGVEHDVQRRFDDKLDEFVMWVVHRRDRYGQRSSGL